MFRNFKDNILMNEIAIFFYVPVQDISLSRPFMKSLFAYKMPLKKSKLLYF